MFILNNMVKFKCNFCYISFQCKHVSRQGLKFEFGSTLFYLYNYVLLIQILHLTLIVEVKSIGVFCNAIIANFIYDVSITHYLFNPLLLSLVNHD